MDNGFIRATKRSGNGDIWFTWNRAKAHDVRIAIDPAHATQMTKHEAQTLVNYNLDFFSRFSNVRWYRIPEEN